MKRIIDTTWKELVLIVLWLFVVGDFVFAVWEVGHGIYETGYADGAASTLTAGYIPYGTDGLSTSTLESDFYDPSTEEFSKPH